MKYVSKHEDRDSKLPEVREELLEKIIASLKQKSDVVGIFLGGSLSKSNFDLFSDIDLRIVVSDEKFSEYVRSKQDLPKQWGRVLFFEDLYPKAPFTIANFDNFIKVDVFFYTTGKIEPSIWFKGIKILHDTGGLLNELLNKSNEYQYQVSREDVIRWRGKVFSYIHEVYRRVRREEYYYALTMMNNLRSFIVQGWDMCNNHQPNDAWDWSKIEGSRTHLELWQLSLLESWSCGRDQTEIMKTLQSMVPEITRINKSLIEHSGLNDIDEVINEVIEQVL
jgi:predicted nucleotidyltransferase